MTSRPAPALELRKHPRAQLHLPVRIRWQSPLGMRLELAQTIDVARGGLLVHRAGQCSAQARVWIAFPYDPGAGSSVQPETPARVVRVESDTGPGFRVALQLDLPSREPVRLASVDRRAHPRLPFALPIFVRPTGSQWPEESMTHNVSSSGASFETSHIYASGDAVLVKIPWGEWERAGEIHGRVVRVECIKNQSRPAPQADPDAGISALVTRVSVRWTMPENSDASKPSPLQS